MDATTIFNKSQCSINLSKNSKGYTWDVKAYADTMEEAHKIVVEENKKLASEYPNQ